MSSAFSNEDETNILNVLHSFELNSTRTVMPNETRPHDQGLRAFLYKCWRTIRMCDPGLSCFGKITCALIVIIVFLYMRVQYLSWRLDNGGASAPAIIWKAIFRG